MKNRTIFVVAAAFTLVVLGGYFRAAPTAQQPQSGRF